MKEAHELEVVQLSIRELKEAIDLSWVLPAIYDTYPNSEAKYRVPWRKDNKPSLYLSRDNIRWTDASTGDYGDIYDLIQLVEEVERFDRKVSIARTILVRQRLAEVDGKYRKVARMKKPYQGGKLKLDSSVTALAQWYVSYKNDHPAIPELQTIINDWSIGIDSAGDVYAYYPGHKACKNITQRKSVEGSEVALYGEIKTSNNLVVVCEGESDTWTMYDIFRKGIEEGHTAVVGLPGVTFDVDTLIPDPRHIRNKSYILAFDGDLAGRKAAEKWARELTSVGCEAVYVLPVPYQKDVSSLDRTILSVIIDQPMVYAPEASAMVNATVAHGYTIKDKQISDWVLDVSRVFFDDHYIAGYKGTLQPQNRVVTLLVADLLNSSTISRWCVDNGTHWYGSNIDTQRLAAKIQADAIVAPVARFTRRVGLHKGDYVWTTGSVGRNEWICKPPSLAVDNLIAIPYPDIAEARETLTNLMSLHLSKVIDPVMSWLVVSLLRPLLKEFPILHITGSSGCGKTTIAQICQYLVTGSQIHTNLTSTTPFAITMYLNSSNAFPVWFDEYRPGARDDALATLNQLLRDSYTGQISTRGELGNTGGAKITSTHTDIPIMVTGEDTLSETSHIDRSIMIHIPPDGKNVGAYRALDFSSPIARHLMRWLISNNHTTDTSLRDTVLHLADDRDYTGLSLRQQINFGTLDLGWRLLKEFATDILDVELATEPNFTGILTDSREALATSPILEAIQWIYESGRPGVIATGDILRLQPAEILRQCRDNPSIVLPMTKAPALKRYFMENLAGRENRARLHGRHLRVIEVSRDWLQLGDT